MKASKIIVLLLVMVITLTGCSIGQIVANNNVETLKDWFFQYNEGTKDYSLFFALCDKNGKSISSNATVDIRIVNSADETVFEGTKSVNKSDFGYYSSQSEGEKYLANLRIAESAITPGKAADGTVYFTVYNDNSFRFDECNCKVLYNLPAKDFDITAEKLPVEVKMKSYNGSTQSKLLIDSITYQVEGSILPTIKIVISGKKTYGNGSGMYDIFNYKLYDSSGYMVKSGSIFLDALNSGDKFKYDSLVLYDISPGEKYTIKFFDYQ